MPLGWRKTTEKPVGGMRTEPDSSLHGSTLQSAMQHGLAQPLSARPEQAARHAGFPLDSWSCKCSDGIGARQGFQSVGCRLLGLIRLAAEFLGMFVLVILLLSLPAQRVARPYWLKQ
eukprot:5159561-Amphidinium_carterae.1